MKRLLSIISILILCLALTACSKGAISGEPETYYNPDQSFSVDLPTAGEGAWVYGENAAGNVLDVTDSADTVRIHVHCSSKLQMGSIAPDLASYQDYSVMNTFSDILTSAEMTSASVETPEFITDSTAASFTYDGAKGLVVFMESEKSYYTYLVLAVEDAYDLNEDMILESILSLKEISEPVS